MRVVKIPTKQPGVFYGSYNADLSKIEVSCKCGASILTEE